MRNIYTSRRSHTPQSNSSAELYRVFVRSIVTTQQVWGLYSEGWAVGATSQGRYSLPLWSDRAIAALCQSGLWYAHPPTAMSLSDFIFKMLPYAIEKNILLSLMMTPDGQSVFIEPSKVLSDIKLYLEDVYSYYPDFFKENPNVPLPDDI